MELNLPIRDQIALPPDWLLQLIASPATRQPSPPAAGFELNTAAESFLGFQMPPDGSIGEGGRNNFLSKAAGWIQSQGIKSGALFQMLSAFNVAKCSPPLDTD